MKTLFILAGGFGSRLRSVVSDVPKPLAPVAGEPFLKLLIKNYISQGANDLVLLLHFEAHKIKEMLAKMTEDGELNEIRIRVIIENNPLGTGGSILNAIKTIDSTDSFFVINADTWLGKGLDLMNDSNPPSIASVMMKNCDRYGSLDIYNNKIKSFNEKRIGKKNGWINAGMYYLDKDNFIDFEVGSFFSLEEEILPKLAFSGELRVVRLETEFIDIGVPEDYFRFCKWINGKKKNEL